MIQIQNSQYGSEADENDNYNINIDKPRYDQSTYLGRARHFALLTNPLNLMATNVELERAKHLVDSYRQFRVLPRDCDVEQLWRAKYLVDSAYHPCTKEKMFVLGRMSAQVPCSLVITAGMLTFYRSKLGIISWQWIMQSYNAIVNHTNRSGDKPIPIERIGVSFGIATTTATATALFLNSLAKKRGPACSPLVARLVPFAAVFVANCINIPFMRSSELQHGIQLYDANNQKVALSQYAASMAVAKVIFSRKCLRVAAMVVPPLLMHSLEQRVPKIRLNRFINFGLQLAFIGSSLILATPLSCAIYPQKCEIKVEQLESSTQRELAEKGFSPQDVVFYNKGL